MKDPEIIIDALTSRIESLTDDYESQIRNLRRQKNGEIDLLSKQVFFYRMLAFNYNICEIVPLLIKRMESEIATHFDKNSTPLEKLNETQIFAMQAILAQDKNNNRLTPEQRSSLNNIYDKLDEILGDEF
ncbi:hypothetical protein A9308_00630 [Moraxella atlantae]|uniref:Uncharacterized protein n=1 Tax=Faucicola atlantae TaxID=34059 RepID=A0A1B8Q939_9GAMM|nr:hypothetical protein [Moraxella atlantae]OBX73749.1 hypothetical protein A9308_00630 [Moraxella atlantae]